MKTINVEELPEPVALVIESMVQTLKAQLGVARDRKPERHVTFHTKPGLALTSLRREDIYGDAV
jgi:hypothetical protein